MTELRNVTLRHLRAFVALADTGSFTIAAQKLFVTQSSLTATIQQLEMAVGVKLFHRTTRRVEMTEEATRFKGKAEAILREFNVALTDLKANGQGEQGHIRIAAASSFIYRFLVTAISQLRLAYPGVTVTLRDAGAARLEELVALGDVDFAVASPPARLPDLDYVPLLADRYGVVCNPGFHLSESKSPMRWNALPTEEFVALCADTGIGSFLHEQMGHLPIFQAPHDEVSSTTSLHALLHIRGGYSILPSLAATYGPFIDFHFRPLERPMVYREVFLITRKLRSLTPISQKLLEGLMKAIRSQTFPPGVVRAGGKLTK